MLKNLWVALDKLFNELLRDDHVEDFELLGAGAFIAPGVCLACSGHAIHPSQRNRMLTSAPITLGENVWLGANVTVVGGVSIGDGSVIGAGSVVTKDIPAGVIAAGSPCKVIREITEDDLLEEIQ